jgi:hypothetical protein
MSSTFAGAEYLAPRGILLSLEGKRQSSKVTLSGKAKYSNEKELASHPVSDVHGVNSKITT